MSFVDHLIIPATKADLVSLGTSKLDSLKHSLEDMANAAFKKHGKELKPGYFDALLGNPHFRVLLQVYAPSGQQAGYAVVLDKSVPVGNGPVVVSYLDKVIVDSSVTRNGYGKALVLSALNHTESGQKMVGLRTSIEENVPFYMALGEELKREGTPYRMVPQDPDTPINSYHIFLYRTGAQPVDLLKKVAMQLSLVPPTLRDLLRHPRPILELGLAY